MVIVTYHSAFVWEGMRQSPSHMPHVPKCVPSHTSCKQMLGHSDTTCVMLAAQPEQGTSIIYILQLCQPALWISDLDGDVK